MQILAAVIATSANAQVFNIPDLGDFDLDAFGLGTGGFGDIEAFGAPAESPFAAPAESSFGAPADDNQRYFITPDEDEDEDESEDEDDTPTVTGTSCWKCDRMSYNECATLGYMQVCPLGDLDCCFVEIRETNQNLKQLCTGCKDYRACKDNQLENFYGSTNVPPVPTSNHQCRPDYRQQKIGRRGPQQSVCRQCFATCDPDEAETGGTSKCFGSIVDKDNNAGQFRLTLKTVDALEYVNADGDTVPRYPWGGHYTGNENADTLIAFGIPTFGALDGTTDAAVITKIVDFDTTENESTLNIWFDNEADGKVDASLANGAKDRATEMTYWALQGADQAWWSSDLKAIQTVLDAKVEEGTAITAADFNPVIV